MNKVKELEEQIIHHKMLYYAGRPEISDYKFDKLEEQLKNICPDSLVLEMIGAIPVTGEKVKHDKKMLSLAKTYKSEELAAWLGENQAVSMFKIDGVSCSLVYEKGKLVLAKTRGDGVMGENITAKVYWIDSIPKEISGSINKFEIRGELFCSESNFFHLSEEMVAKGLDKPSSQRNIVAGLISRKDNLELCRHIEFRAFDLIEEKVQKGKEFDKLKRIQSMGFSLLDFIEHKNSSTIDDVINEAKNFMANGEFLIDGIVFTYNDLALQEELGETAHHPRYKMAFKFKGEAKKTIINNILWSVSRNGILTPVADVSTVELSGAKISRVTLHNYGLVKQHELKSGDEIEIIRSGEVIPKFLSVIKSADKPFEIPKFCPSCGMKTEIEDIRLFCRNEECPGKIKESFLNFIQKIGIDDLSSKRLDEFIKEGIVHKIEDLYKIEPNDLLVLDKFKEKLANKIVSSIQKSKNVDFTTFLSSLGIAGGAYNKCEKIVSAGINTIEKMNALSVEKLMEIDSFAEKSAVDFLQSLKEKNDLIGELVKVGFNFVAVDNSRSPINGKKICITGALSEKRSVIEANIRNAGGIVVTSVSKNTDFLLTNERDSNSSKFKKAQTLNIKIVSEIEMKELIGGEKE